MMEFLKKLAKQAGLMALADQATLSGSNVHNKSLLDLVTDTDRKVEAFITEALAKKFPEYGIYGETPSRRFSEARPHAKNRRGSHLRYHD